MTPGTLINLCGGALFCVATAGTLSDGNWIVALAAVATAGVIWLRRHMKKETHDDFQQ